MRNLTESQMQLLNVVSTKPIFLIEVDFSGVEYLSTNGDLNINGNVYTGGDVGISSVSDWTSANIKLSPTSGRVAEIVTGGWQGNSCKIYVAPAVNNQLIMDQGYVADDYALDGYIIDDPILLLDGVLTSADVNSEVVSVNVSHKALVGKWSPRLRITSSIANHLPANGSTFVWEGDNYILESKN